MLRQRHRVGQPSHRLETRTRASMRTASEEPLWLNRESDFDGALRVTGLRGLLYLPEALGANHDRKVATFVGHPDPLLPRIRSALDPSSLMFVRLR
jgi:hypothetical protein